MGGAVGTSWMSPWTGRILALAVISAGSTSGHEDPRREPSSQASPAPAGATLEVDVSASVGYQGLGVLSLSHQNSEELLALAEDPSLGSPTSHLSLDADDPDAFSFTTGVGVPLQHSGHDFGIAYAIDADVNLAGNWFAAYVVADTSGPDLVNQSIAVASFDGSAWTSRAMPANNGCGGSTSPKLEAPTIAITKGACTTTRNYIHVAWVETVGGVQNIRYRLSTNGGASWTGTQTVNQSPADTAMGGRIARPSIDVGDDGKGYVTWLQEDGSGAEIRFQRFTTSGFLDGSNTLVQTVQIGCAGADCGIDPGCSGTRRVGSTPELAVDRSLTASRGAIYVVYADDLGAGDGLDVFVASSIDGGATWASARMNTDATGAGPLHHQFGPSVAVNATDGRVHTSWYDRRNDSGNCLTEVWRASVEGPGSAWSANAPVVPGFTPTDFSSDSGESPAHTSTEVFGPFGYVGWTDGRDGDFDLYAARFDAEGGTVISGPITDDQLWALDDGPFSVIGDTTIESGATVTVEPGVEVFIAECRENGSGKISFDVAGVLNAQGTASDPIRFVSGRGVPQAGDWAGVEFGNTLESSSSNLTYVDIAHAQTGIVLTSSSPTLVDVSIDSASFRGISGNARSSIAFSPSRLSIDQASFEAVNVSGSGGTWSELWVRNSGGVVINGGAQLIRVVGADIQGNDAGLTVSSFGGAVEVALSTLVANMGTGLTITGVGPRSVVANDIRLNTANGLAIQNGSSTWGRVSAHRNNLADNAGFDLKQEPASLPVDARANWWGAASAAEVSGYPGNVTKIEDVHDVASLRHVDYRLPAAGLLPDVGASFVGPDSYLVLPAATSDQMLRISGGAAALAGVASVRIEVERACDSAVVLDQTATLQGAAFFLNWLPDPGPCAIPVDFTVRATAIDNDGTVEASPDVKVVALVDEPTRSGEITSDETWLADRDMDGTPDPILLSGDVTVKAGATLTIEQGAIVQSMFLTDGTFGGLDPSRIELRVEGNLIVNGTVGNPVRFESSRLPEGFPKDWYGIVYLDTTTDTLSKINGAQIRDANDGITLTQAAPDVTNTRLHRNFRFGVTGTSGSLSRPLWRFTANTLEYNGSSGGDLVVQTRVEIAGGVARNNGGHGLRIDSSPSPVEVRAFLAEQNQQDGLRVEGGNDSDVNTVDVLIVDSSSISNGAYGVNVVSSGPETKIENVVSNANGTSGVRVGSGSTVWLLNSELRLNGRGLEVLSPRLIAAYNTIADNLGAQGPTILPGSGLLYGTSSGPPAVLGLNRIANGSPEIQIEGSRALDARRNWWGEATTLELGAVDYPADQQRFEDIWDDADRGHVDWSRYCPSAAACPTAGRDPLRQRAANVTFPGPGDPVSVNNLIVRGVAYSRAGIVKVEVSTDSACDSAPASCGWEAATGEESWSWEWQAGSDPTQIWVRVCDLIGGGEVCSIPSESLDFTLLPGMPATSGDICPTPPCEATWSGQIELTGDVHVPEGTVLRIEPDAVILAQPNTDDRFDGDDLSRIEVIVEGSVVVNEAGGGEVLWSSARSSATSTCSDGVTPCVTTADCGASACVPDDVQPRDWRGLRFENASLDYSTCSETDQSCESNADCPGAETCRPGNLLRNMQITSGWDGIHFRRSGGTLDEVASTRNFESGLLFSRDNLGWPAEVHVTGGSFSANGNHGIRVTSRSHIQTLWSFSGVLLEGNVGNGIDAVSNQNIQDAWVVRDAVIQNNSARGMDLNHPWVVPNLVVGGTTFSQNGGDALRGKFGDLEVFDSDFNSNTGIGLSVTATRSLLYKNTFQSNSRSIHLMSGTMSAMAFNDFGPSNSSSAANVTTQLSQASIVHFNNFPDTPSSLLLRNEAPGSINAPGTWWGSVATAEMNSAGFPANISSLFDVEDNPALGRIDYRGHRGLADGPIDLGPPFHCDFSVPGAAPLSGGAGSEFTVRGGAAAAEGVESVEIRVETIGGAVEQDWVLTEGTIGWSSELAGLGTGDYRLKCRVTDREGGQFVSGTLFSRDRTSLGPARSRRTRRGRIRG